MRPKFSSVVWPVPSNRLCHIEQAWFEQTCIEQVPLFRRSRLSQQKQAMHADASQHCMSVVRPVLVVLRGKV